MIEIHQQVYRNVQRHEWGELREGEQYRATIKERLGDQEALLSIRGRDVKATVEGEWPQSERVHVKILEKQGDHVRVQIVSEAANAPQASAKEESAPIWRQLGVSQPSQELSRALQILSEKGLALTKENVRVLQQFLQNGNTEQKLETIQALANKRLPITIAHVTAIDAALHGKPLNELFHELAKELDPEFKTETGQRDNRRITDVIREAKRLIEREGLNERTLSTIRSKLQHHASVAQAVDEAEGLWRNGKEREAVTRLITAFDRELARETRRQTAQTAQSETTDSAQLRASIVEQLQQLERSSSTRRDEAFIRAVREVIERAPSVERGLEQVRQIIQERMTASILERPSLETGQRVEAVLEQAGRELTRHVEAPVRHENIERPNQQETVRQVERQRPDRANQPVRQSELQTRQNASELSRVANDTRPAETNLRETVQRLEREIARTESVTRATAIIREQLLSKEMSHEVRQLVERSVLEANHLNRVGRDRLLQVVQQLENDVTTEEARAALRDLRTLLQTEGAMKKIVEAGNALKQVLANDAAKQQLHRALVQAEQLERAGIERMLQALAKLEQHLPVDRIETPERAIATMLKDVREGIQKEADFSKALARLRSVFNDQRLTTDDRALLQQAIDTASKRHEQGRELAARQEVLQALQQLEQKYPLPDPYEQLFPLQAASKAIAVTTITEKLAQMAADFKQMQREITRTLDVIARQIELFRFQAKTHVKPLLEATIKKLDNAILRSEMMLVTDMKTEKRLMQASGQLAEAKKLLEKGQLTEAKRIVNEVKQLIERLQFRPSETKVKHYTALSERTEDAFLQRYKETLQHHVRDGSARTMFEYVRSLGLNRDSEIAQRLVARQHGEAPQDLKSALLKLLSSEEEGSRAHQLANQALANVTGQQLLSRSDQQSVMQNLFFNLPFLLQDQVENLQVFVNSRKGGGQIDWENCQLYFLIETPRLGETGIMLQVVDRKLSVTLKNDKPDFKEKMMPLVEKTVNKLEEIGFTINGIQFAQLTPPKQEKTMENEKRQQRPIFTKEGFDFKI